MNKQEVILLAQLLNAMNDAVERLNVVYNSKSVEDVENIKKEILDLQKRVGALVR